MADRGKVIKGLEACIPDAILAPGCYVYGQLMRDALALLKEQETVEPIDLKFFTGRIAWGCPICERWLDHDWKYCPYCGKKVKWDD